MQSLFGGTKFDTSRGRQQLANGPITWPSEWAPRVTELAKIDAPLTDVANPFAEGPLPKWAVRESLSNYFAADETVVRVALQVEAELHPSLLMVLMQGIDRTSHSLWGTIEPAELYPESLRANSAEREGGARALRRYYEYADALTGKLLERYTEDDLVIVVSDHGFEASATRATYDDTPVDRLAAEPSRTADEVMQNLRALRYVQ